MVEEVEPFVVVRVFAVIDEQAVDDDFAGHIAGVAEVVRTVVPAADQAWPQARAVARDPAAVADHPPPLPGAAVVAAQPNEGTAVDGGILHGEHTATNGVEARRPEHGPAERVLAGDALVRVHPRQHAILDHDILAEVRPDDAPTTAIVDVIHPAVDHREVDHKQPLSKGGSNANTNLRITSRSKNRRKGAS